MPSSRLPSRMEILGAVCLLLVRVPNRRPTTADVAALFGYSERVFRHVWRLSRQESVSSLIAFGCGLRAIWLVSQEGQKTIVATLETGHRSQWNLNRQLKRRIGVTLGECRSGLPQCFDWHSLCQAYLRINANISNEMRVGA
jgi:hypothetical protein